MCDCKDVEWSDRVALGVKVMEMCGVECTQVRTTTGSNCARCINYFCEIIHIYKLSCDNI